MSVIVRVLITKSCLLVDKPNVDQPPVKHFNSSRTKSAKPIPNGSTRSSTSPFTSRKQYRAPNKGNPHHKSNIHYQPKSFNKCQQYRKKRPRPVKVLASKPWKQLADVEPHMNGASIGTVVEPHMNGASVDTVAKEEKKNVITTDEDCLRLSPSDLEDILSSDVSLVSHAPTFTPVNDVVWTESADAHADWPFISTSDISSEVSCQTQTQPNSSVKQVESSAGLTVADTATRSEMARSWRDDYQEVEEQMSRLLFCEDLEEGPTGSRYLNLFRENPLAHGIRTGCLRSQVEMEVVNPELMNCKHCEQSYEVVLESELTTSSKPVYRSNLLRHADSRLNFDWTKYHPPPWSRYQDETDSETNTSKPTISCDCEFCRSRVWRRACRWCATPL